jgi:predicted DNA-binding transcriptional regulator YafY
VGEYLRNQRGHDSIIALRAAPTGVSVDPVCPRKSRTTSPRLSRCLRLANLLASPLDYTVSQLASELGVSTRTIYRDLCVLKEAGILVDANTNQNGYVIKLHFQATPRHLTENELVILLLMAHTSPLLSSHTLRAIMHQAIAKLIKNAPRHLRHDAGRLLRSCVPACSDMHHQADRDDLFASLVLAIRQKRCVRLHYHDGNGSGELIKTKVAPYRFAVCPKGGYLVGRSSLHRGIHCFALEDVLQVEITEDPYDLPARYRRYRHASDLGVLPRESRNSETRSPCPGTRPRESKREGPLRPRQTG